MHHDQEHASKEMAARFKQLASEYSAADWGRDDLITRAAERALDNMLNAYYEDPEPRSERPTPAQMEAMWKAYARAHC